MLHFIIMMEKEAPHLLLHQKGCISHFIVKIFKIYPSKLCTNHFWKGMFSLLHAMLKKGVYDCVPKFLGGRNGRYFTFSNGLGEKILFS